MAINSFTGQARGGPPRQGMQPNWTPMAPKVHDSSELETELHEMTLGEWIDDHPHFIPSIAGSVEDIIMECLFRFSVESGFAELMQAFATFINVQQGIIDKQKYPNWLNEMNAKLNKLVLIGTPNTDTQGTPLKITDGMKFDSSSIHAEALDDLKTRLEHNHQVHVANGRAHWDPDSHSTWSQYGIASPKGYNPDGSPHDDYNFVPHNEWGGDLYGQQGHPDQMIAGGQTQTGKGLFSLFSGVLRMTAKGGAAAAL